MIRLGIKTKLNPEKSIEKAREFFGEKGLEAKDKGANCVYFEGGGGYIEVTARAEEKGGSSVDMQATEMEQEVKEFASKIA
jgi:hypothetical protein